jgi:signal peptidase I
MGLMNNTISLDLEGEKISFQRAREIIKAVLETGKPIELIAAGYSMFPTFRSGDKITVKPLVNEEVPVLGSVLVYENNGVFVMHRLINIITAKSGKKLFVTRGDSLNEPDKPWPQQQLLGVAVSYKRSGKEHLIKKFIPDAWRYKYNRRFLWMFGKIKRLSMGPGKLLKSKQ